MKSNERLCILCKEIYVEDDIHIFNVCKIYDFHRKKLYNYVKEKHDSVYLSDENKFIILLKYKVKNWTNICLRHGI